MKRKTVLYLISIFIFLIIAATAFYIARPIVKRSYRELEKIEASYRKKLADETGLSLSYHSLSPSILTGLHISGIEVMDVESKKVLAKIQSIRLSWNCIALIKGDYDNCFDTLVIDNISLNYNDLDDYNSKDKIISLIKNLDQNENSTQFSLPFGIFLKNATISFKNADGEASLFLSMVKIGVQERTGFLTYQSRGTISCTLLKKPLSVLKEITCDFSVQGGLPRYFENSYTQLTLSKIDTDLFYTKKLDFNVTFSHDVINLGIIQSGQPFELSIAYDTRKKKTSLKFEAERFKPLSLFDVKLTNEYAKKLKYLSLSGRYAGTLFFDNFDFFYKASGSAYLPKALVDGGGNLSYDFSGGVKDAIIKKFAISSSFLKASYSGSIDFVHKAPEGILSVDTVVLQNGNTINTEIYLSPLDQGFLCFIPSLSLGNSQLTALELDCVLRDSSLDFSFEAYDYSHFELSDSAKIAVNGSLEFIDTFYLQSQLSMQNFFADTALNVASFFLDKAFVDKISLLESFSTNYIFTFDTYISFDSKQLSYNVPYFVGANIKDDSQMLLLSLDGNTETFRVSQCEVLFAGQKLTSVFSADFSDLSKIFFSSRINFNALPYSFSGVFIPNESLSISGDYNFTADLIFPKEGILKSDELEFSIQAVSLPVAFQKVRLLTEFDVRFNASPENWRASIDTFSVQDISGSLKSNPRLDLTGFVDKFGFSTTSLTISDKISALEGMLTVSWDITESLFKSSFVNFEIANDALGEEISASFDLINPSFKDFSTFSLQSDMYISGSCFLKNIAAAHFLKAQKLTDTISASASILGTLEIPSVQLKVESASVHSGSELVSFSGDINLEDKDFFASNIEATYSSFRLTTLEGAFSLDSFSGKFDLSVEGELGLRDFLAGDHFETDATITISSEVLTSKNVENTLCALTGRRFFIDVEMPLLKGNFIRDRENFTIHAAIEPSYTYFEIGRIKEFFGTFYTSGKISLTGTEHAAVKFDGSGTISGDSIYLLLENMSSDLSKWSGILDLSIFSLLGGRAEGSLSISGLLSNPMMNGHFDAYDIKASVPDFLGEKAYAKTGSCDVVDSTFTFHDIVAIGEDSGGMADVVFVLTLENFIPVYRLCLVDSIDEKPVNGFIDIGSATVSAIGNVHLKVELIPNLIMASGMVNLDGVEAVLSNLSMEQEPQDPKNAILEDILVDVTINLGQKSQLYFPSKENPVVRSLVGQETPLHFIMDSGTDTYSLTGDITLKGGEILYVSRTFYLKNGKIALDVTESKIDPIISFLAEVRERDTNGELVKMYLSAEEQRLSNLDPQLTSVPSKSRNELMQLLGQAVFADAVNSKNPIGQVFAGVLDYGFQIGIMRRVENQLRDFFNFDIFSFRTPFLQNTVMSIFNRNIGENNMSVGNYLDGSTVYIGKYIGDTLYADMMLEVTYDTTATANSAKGFHFKPEIGLELPSPFATIRWSIAPDVTSDWKLLVPYTTISLSWKFVF